MYGPEPSVRPAHYPPEYSGYLVGDERVEGDAVKTGAVMISEFEDVELAVSRVLGTAAVAMCATREMFDIQVARVLDEHFPGRSDEFRTWIKDKAWSRHSELQLRVELPASQWLAVLAAVKSAAQPSPDALAAAEVLRDRLAKAGVEIPDEPVQ